MTEEKFFKSVHDSLSNYAPEVPASVYAGVRRKLWLSGFLSFNWNQLNIWYVLIGASMLSSLFFMGNNESAVAKKVDQNAPKMELMAAPTTTPTTTIETATVSCSNANKATCVSSCKGKTTIHTAENVSAPTIGETTVEASAPKEEINVVEAATVVEPEVVTAEAPKKKKEPKGKGLKVEVLVDETKK